MEDMKKKIKEYVGIILHMHDMSPWRSEGNQKRMDKIMEFLPFLIPLVIAEFALLGYTLHHILTHKNYKRGNRTLWLIITIVLMNFVGPIMYFLLGKEDA